MLGREAPSTEPVDKLVDKRRRYATTLSGLWHLHRLLNFYANSPSGYFFRIFSLQTKSAAPDCAIPRIRKAMLHRSANLWVTC
jgi:hypothetical protein